MRSECAKATTSPHRQDTKPLDEFRSLCGFDSGIDKGGLFLLDQGEKLIAARNSLTNHDAVSFNLDHHSLNFGQKTLQTSELVLRDLVGGLAGHALLIGFVGETLSR